MHYQGYQISMQYFTSSMYIKRLKHTRKSLACHLKSFKAFVFQLKNALAQMYSVCTWGIVRAWLMSDFIQHYLAVKLYSDVLLKVTSLHEC